MKDANGLNVKYGDEVYVKGTVGTEGVHVEPKWFDPSRVYRADSMFHLSDEQRELILHWCDLSEVEANGNIEGLFAENMDAKSKAELADEGREFLAKVKALADCLRVAPVKGGEG